MVGSSRTQTQNDPSSCPLVFPLDSAVTVGALRVATPCKLLLVTAGSYLATAALQVEPGPLGMTLIFLQGR